MIGNDNFSYSVQALKRFVAKFKPDTSTQMKSVIAALYLAQNNQSFRYTNLIGLLQLDVDRKLKTKFLRFYNLQTMKLSFQVQLYYEFGQYYQKKDDLFYFFQYSVGTVGLLFRSKEDADIMCSKIKEVSPKRQELDQIIKEKTEKNKKQQQSNSLFGMLKRKVFKKEQEVKKQSQVLQVQKLFSTEIDQNGSFKTSGQSPVEKDILERLGLSQNQKNNPQIMGMIANDLLIYNIKKQAQQNPNKQLLELIKEHEKQQNQYLQDCRKTKLLNLPPPPPPPPLLSPANTRVSFGNKRSNLMEQIRNNNLKLKHVKTNEKGGVNIDLSNMDTEERSDFATEMRKKIAMRKKALNKWNDDEDDD